MTLETTTSRVSFAGNGVTTAFSFPYYFLEEADLVVILVDSDLDEDEQTLTTDYTITGEGESAGGTVTMLTAPAVGETLVIYRDPELTQDLDLVENDPLPVEEVEERLDKLMMIAQRHGVQLSRSVMLADGVTATFDPTLPDDAASNGGSVMMLNDDGDGFEWGPSGAEIEDAADNAAFIEALYGDGAIYPTGFTLANNTAATNVTGLIFDSSETVKARVTYYYSRGTRKGEGTFLVLWDGSVWSLIGHRYEGINGDNGLTPTMGTAGQVKLASDNSGSATTIEFNAECTNA